MTTSLVLALADFTKTFVVETDAHSKGMEVVLMQEDIWAYQLMRRNI